MTRSPPRTTQSRLTTTARAWPPSHARPPAHPPPPQLPDPPPTCSPHPSAPPLRPGLYPVQRRRATPIGRSVAVPVPSWGRPRQLRLPPSAVGRARCSVFLEAGIARCEAGGGAPGGWGGVGERERRRRRAAKGECARRARRVPSRRGYRHAAVAAAAAAPPTPPTFSIFYSFFYFLFWERRAAPRCWPKAPQRQAGCGGGGRTRHSGRGCHPSRAPSCGHA